jgi:hypothetical protein
VLNTGVRVPRGGSFGGAARALNTLAGAAAASSPGPAMLPYLEAPSPQKRFGATAGHPARLPPVSRWHAEVTRGVVRRGEVRCTPLFEPTQAVGKNVYGGTIGSGQRPKNGRMF